MAGTSVLERALAIFEEDKAPQARAVQGGAVMTDTTGRTPPAIPVTQKPSISEAPAVVTRTTLPGVPTDPGTDDMSSKALSARAKELTETAVNNLPDPDVNMPLDFNHDFFNHLRSKETPFTGLGKDFLRKTGVNDTSHKDTLRYSRLVDMLNNRRYIGPAKGGTADLVRGSMVTTGNSAIGPGDIYKMDGLETAESRAQRRAEEYEALDRERDIQRVHDVKDMPAALERLKHLQVLEQAGKLTDAQVQERQQLFAALLNNQYNLPYMMMQTRFNKDLDMTQQQYAAELALQMTKYAAETGVTVQRFAAQLGMDAAQYNNMLGLVTQQYGTVLAEYLQRVVGIGIPVDKVNNMMLYHTGNAVDYARSGMLGTAFGIPSMDMGTMMWLGNWIDAGYNAMNAGDIPKLLAGMQKLSTEMTKAGVDASGASATAQGGKP
jgi:hypothetical protein